MVSIKYFNSKGQKVNSISDLILEGVVDVIKNHINEKLAHLENEINAEGGNIRVKVGKNAEVTTEGFSKELDEKIAKALQ